MKSEQRSGHKGCHPRGVPSIRNATCYTRIQRLSYHQAPVVEMSDSAIHSDKKQWIKQFAPLIIFRRMVIYPMNNAIQSYNLDHSVVYLEVTGCSFNIPVSGIKLEHTSKANLKQLLFLLAHRYRTA